jgi:lipopolysaccharide transport system permease protein
VNTSPGLLRDIARHKDLIVGLTRRELFSPFAGSGFGIVWSLLHPVLQMLVYMVVFSYIFQIRMGEDATGGLGDYPAFVLSGLVPWLAWSALLNTACSTVINSASLVKQADFPAEVLPLRTLLVCLVPHLVSILVLGLYVLIGHGTLPGSPTLLLPALLLSAVAMLGVSYILSAVCVFVRDIKEVVFVLSGLGMFLTPALYPPDMMDSRPVLSALININPISHFVNIYRDALYWGEMRHTVSWWLAAVFAALALYVGRRGFLRLRLFFGNFL